MKSIILIAFLAASANAQVISMYSPVGYSIPQSDGRYVYKSGDVMSGPLQTSSLTVTGDGFSVGGSSLVVAGGKVLMGGAVSNANATMGIGKPVSPTGYVGILLNNDTPIAGRNSTNTTYYGIARVTSANTVNLGSFDPGNGSGAVNVSLVHTGSEAIGIYGVNDVRVPGNSFSVGTSTLVVKNGSVGIGNTNPDTKLHISSGEIKSDGNLSAMPGWFTGASKGIYAYNATAGTISSGTVVTYAAQYPNAYGNIGVSTAAANSQAPVGTVFPTAGCAAGALCQICTEGLCPARLDSGSACAATNDSVLTGTEVGRAACVSGPAAATTHWQELGQPAIFTAQNGHVIWIFAHRN